MTAKPCHIEHLKLQLAVDTAIETPQSCPHAHDAFSPSLISHAARHHSNRSQNAIRNPTPINIFSNATLSSKYRKQWSRSFSNISDNFSTGSSSSFFHSENDSDDDDSDDDSEDTVVKERVQKEDDDNDDEEEEDNSDLSYSSQSDIEDSDAFTTSETNELTLSHINIDTKPPTALNIGELNLRVSVSEDDEEGTWAHSRHMDRKPSASAMCLLQRSTSGDSQPSPENRRYSVLKTPKGTLHVKGFSEGIGQFGISRGPSSSWSTKESGPGSDHAQPRHLSRGNSLASVPEDSYQACTQLPMKDRLVVLSKLGQGASSIVYKAFDITRMKLVALKTVPIYDRDKRRQMARELNTLYNILQEKKEVLKKNASAANSPAHSSSLKEGGVDLLLSPARSDGKVANFESLQENDNDLQEVPQSHIVEFYDAFSDLEDAVALVVEYMDGGSLQDLADAGGCACEAVLANISAQALAGLSFLHRHCQIHRDIKPANLLINLNGDVKVSDLGILREVNPAVDTDHFVHTYIGTATYMSPERIDALDYSYSSDIWSFGMTMLTLSFGKLPHQVSGGYWTILSNMHNKPSPSLLDDDNFQHKWSPEYVDFISQCLQKDPTQRATATELLQHPFLTNAFPESFEKSDVESVGVVELESILNSLLLHIDARETPALDVYIVMRKRIQHDCLTSTTESSAVQEEIEKSNIYMESTLDIFNISEAEMLQCLLFNEYPLYVRERAVSLMSEMSWQLEVEGAEVHIMNRFITSISEGDEDGTGENEGHCSCFCCRGYNSENDGNGGDSGDVTVERLQSLAEQLHLPLDVTVATAREYVLHAHTQQNISA